MPQRTFAGRKSKYTLRTFSSDASESQENELRMCTSVLIDNHANNIEKSQNLIGLHQTHFTAAYFASTWAESRKPAAAPTTIAPRSFLLLPVPEASVSAVKSGKRHTNDSGDHPWIRPSCKPTDFNGFTAELNKYPTLVCFGVNAVAEIATSGVGVRETDGHVSRGGSKDDSGCTVA
jgi:hypothetical protein